MDTKLNDYKWARRLVTFLVVGIWTVVAAGFLVPWAMGEANIIELTPDIDQWDYRYMRYIAVGARLLWPMLWVIWLTMGSGFLLAFIQKLGLGRGSWGKIPLEVYGGIGLFELYLFGSTQGFASIVYALLEENSVFFSQVFHVSTTDGRNMASIIIFIAMFAALFIPFQASASVAAGMRDGFKEYLLTRSLLVKLCVAICRKIKQSYARAMQIDFTKPLARNLVKWAFVNGLIASFLCVWFLGLLSVIIAMFGILVFCVLMYFAASKHLDNFDQSYKVLMDATNRMAQGNLNQPIEGDLQLFNPLKNRLNQVQSGFAQAVEQEVRSRNMKTELITNVSHDLKTPLTAIITYVDLLKNEEVDDATRAEYIQTLDKKCQRLKVLIEDLFEVSKAASGDVVLNMEPLDLAALLRQVQYETEEITAASGVDFRWNIGEEKAMVTLDGQRTCRIFENLVNNIVKYALGGTRAYITLERKPETVQVSFKNVSAQELSPDSLHLTERFVRGDESRSTEGSGLGLAIAKSFTELQAGSFSLETDGDLFKVTVAFPLAGSNGNK